MTAPLTHRAIPGYWYASSEGQLYNVRAFLYHDSRLARIWIEDISGVRASVSPPEWVDLDLVIHSPVRNQMS